MRIMAMRLDFAPFRQILRSEAHYLVGLVLLSGGYVVSISLSYGLPPGLTITVTAANVIPIVIATPLVRLALFRFRLLQGIPRRAALHGALGLFFVLFVLWLQPILLGALRAGSLGTYSVRPFLGPAAGWQFMQSGTLYAVIALLAQRDIERGQRAAEPAGQREAPKPVSFFIKEEDEFRPLDPVRIILARGADDYVELVTDTGKHLVRMTLGRCEEQLGSNFLRVHRSCVVNAARIARAEPSGDGRLLLTMENGETIHTSRAGARLLRERVI
jgi:hypothetical protein